MFRRIPLLAAILATTFASSFRAQQPTFKSGVDLIRLTPGLFDVVATVLAGRQPLGAVEREIIIGQER